MNYGAESKNDLNSLNSGLEIGQGRKTPTTRKLKMRYSLLMQPIGKVTSKESTIASVPFVKGKENLRVGVEWVLAFQAI